MTILKNLLIAGLLVCICSCASLTKTQVASVNTYSGILEKYSDFPGAIIKEFIQVKYEIEQLNTGTFSDTIVNSKLWMSYYGRKKALKEAEKIDIGIKIVAEYASALEKLSSKNLSDNVGKEATKLGTNIDTLISLYNLKSNIKLPNASGVLITDAISLIGSSYVKHWQASELKKCIKEGDTLILILTEAIKTELYNVVINKWLQALKDELKDRQENFLRNLPNSDYKVYFANSFNKEVATLIARIDNLEQLTKKTINSVEHINKAHKQLLENIQKRKKIKEVLSETRQLYVSVNDILSNYQALTKIQ